MREFFRGWRRKAGCVALVMACMLVTIWIRSLIFTDSILFPIHKRQFIISSYQGILFWAGLEVDSFEWTCEFGGPPDEPVFAVRDDQFLPAVESTAGLDVWIVPCWSVTIPLAIVSASLMLWPQRKAMT